MSWTGVLQKTIVFDHVCVSSRFPCVLSSPIPLTDSTCGLQETWYYMPKGRLLRQDDKTADSLKVKGTKKLDDQMFRALTGEEGPLPCGALPAVRAQSEAGQKAILKALDDEGKEVVKQKKPPKKATGDAEPVVPKTVLESRAQCIQIPHLRALELFRLYSKKCHR